MKSIPACFFPTKVLLIDDNADFLKELQMNLSPTTSTYKSYTDPREALKEIHKQHEKNSYLDKWMSHGYAAVESFDYPLRQQIYSPERFEQISTVIVDHTMPGMNGLEFCTQIKDLPVYKIMLTGEADQSIAVRAFNEGIIQGFVRKDDEDFINLLNNLILKGQKEFFTSITNSALEGAKECIFGSLLQHPAYIQIFSEVAERFKIVEYYLMHAVGKFLLGDAQGNLSALFAYSHEEDYMSAEEFFEKGVDFTFPEDPIKNPYASISQKIIKRVKGQEAQPTHSFPVYHIPDNMDYTWGYIPKLMSPKPVISFDKYKKSLLKI